LQIPFATFNARSLSSDQVSAIYYKRNPEEDEIVKHLKFDVKALLLSGSRGSGKTVLLKHLASLGREQLQATPILVQLESSVSITDNKDANRLKFVALKYLWQLWVKEFGGSYLELHNLVSEPSKSAISLLTPAKAKFVDIYRIIRADAQVSGFTSTNQLSAKIGVGIERAEESSRNANFDGVMPFELQLLLSEATELVSHKETKHVILLDEFEIFTGSSPNRSVEEVFELFDFPNVQLVFSVAGTDEFRSKLEPHFDHIVDLEGLPSPQDIALLVSKNFEGSQLKLSEDATKVLFQFFSGHPRKSLNACNRAIKNINGSHAIDAAQMTVACRHVEKLTQHLEKQTSSCLVPDFDGLDSQ